MKDFRKFLDPILCPKCQTPAWEISTFEVKREMLHRIDDITYEVVGSDKVTQVEIFCQECDEWLKIK